MNNPRVDPKTARQIVEEFDELQRKFKEAQQIGQELSPQEKKARNKLLVLIAAIGAPVEDILAIVEQLKIIAEGRESQLPKAVVPGMEEMVNAYEKSKSAQTLEERQVQEALLETLINQYVESRPGIEKVVYSASASEQPQPSGEPPTTEARLLSLNVLARESHREELRRALEGALGPEAARVAGNIEPYLTAWRQQGKMDPQNLKNLLGVEIENILPPQTSREDVIAKIEGATKAVAETPFVSNLLPPRSVGLGEDYTGRQATTPSPKENEPPPEGQPAGEAGKKDARARQEARLLLLVSYHRPSFLREVANTIVGLPFIRPWQIFYAIGREDYARAHPDAAVAVDLFWTHGITADSVSRAIEVLRAGHPDLPANSPVLQGARFLLQSLREYEAGRPFFSFFLKALRSQPDVELVEEAEGVPKEGVPLPTTTRPAKVIRVIWRREGENIFLLRTEQVEQKKEEKEEPGTSFFNTLRNVFRKDGGRSGPRGRLRRELSRWFRRQMGRWFKQTLGRLTTPVKNFFSSAVKRLFGKLSSSIFNFFAGKRVAVQQVAAAAQRGLFSFFKGLFRSIGSFAGRALSTIGRLLGRALQAAVRLITAAVKALIQLAAQLVSLIARAVAAVVQAIAAAVQAIAAAIAAAGIPGLIIVLIIAAVALLIFVGYLIATSSHAPFAEKGKPEALREAVESRYIGLAVEASPTSIPNDKLPAKTEYTLTITAKEAKIDNISVETKFSVYRAVGFGFPTPTPPSLEDIPKSLAPGASATKKFSVEIGTDLKDALFTNTITVTANVEAGPSGEKTRKTTSVVVGNPPTDCLVFENSGAGWSNESQAMIIEALGFIAQARSYVAQLCSPGPIRLQHQTGSQYGGYAPGGDGPDKDLVVIYDLGLINQDVALYTLSHELGHLFQYRYGGVFGKFKDDVFVKTEGYLPTYPYGATQFEDFAETIADFIVWKVYSFRDIGRLDMPRRYFGHYKFAKENIFLGFEY